MEATYVNVNDLRIGKVVAEDIYANTQYPIIYKNTKISHDHIHVLKVFQINKVPILIENVKRETDKRKVEVDQLDEPQVSVEIQEYVASSFENKYQEAVSQFKKEFMNWQAGAKVDITKVRTIILPLVEKTLDDRSIIFDLNSYSNPKDYLYHHCIATGLISAVLVQKLGYDRGITLQMAIAGALADCGMAKVSTKIRDKKGALTQQEFNEIRNHPIYSFNLVKDLPALKEEMKEAIYQHHERLDGSGYTQGIKLNSISLFAQIIAVADTFHAMTSERLYRSKESPFKVVEMIKESEFGKFDIKVVQALIDIVSALPIGTKIELSNLERGEVMYINKFAPTRPLIKLLNTGEIIDLSKIRSFYISRVITNE